MNALPLPDARLSYHFPEASLLATLDAALAATDLALGEEHPAAEALLLEPNAEPPATLLEAYLLRLRIGELRGLLHLYRAAVCRAIGPLDSDQDDEDPF